MYSGVEEENDDEVKDMRDRLILGRRGKTTHGEVKST